MGLLDAGGDAAVASMPDPQPPPVAACPRWSLGRGSIAGVGRGQRCVHAVAASRSGWAPVSSSATRSPEV